MTNKNYWKEKEQQPMEETESAVDGIVMKLKYEVKKDYYTVGDEDVPTIEIVPSEINWMNEEGQYTGWLLASDFDVESLDDYDDFFKREERYFYEQDIYTQQGVDSMKKIEVLISDDAIEKMRTLIMTQKLAQSDSPLTDVVQRIITAIKNEEKTVTFELKKGAKHERRKS